jgi:formylglycine-generating enzyme required for sulfatase activity
MLEPLRDCEDCPLMVPLPAGSFPMGSPEGEEDRFADEGPQQNVALPEFALGQYEVTVGQFKAFVQSTGHDIGDSCWEWDGSQLPENKTRDWRAPGFEQTDDHPVVCVSWEDAQAYAAWLTKETNEPYRLPSEAEWEYACRAGTTTRYSWGDDPPTSELANFGQNVGKTTEVGAYPTNPWGLYGMHGNVWEWVEDCWNESYQGAPSDGSAWTSGNCGRRVLRGGSWVNTPGFLRSAFRNRGSPVSRGVDVGFRVARTLR